LQCRGVEFFASKGLRHTGDQAEIKKD
jgi:hypothetical protein